MEIHFWKYQGTGNDFIMLDGRTTGYDSLSSEKIRYLCHRRFGIGADGLIVLEPSNEADFYMRYYNSDGRISTMCGNGGRCITRFAHDLGIIRDSYSFEAIDGPHESFIADDLVHLRMGDVNQVQDLGNGGFFIDTGSPHFVKWQEELKDGSILEDAQLVRYSDTYRQEGVNVNFVSGSGNVLKMRTYERGVEDETLSCGTGVTAAALVASYLGKLSKNRAEVKTPGGILQLKFVRSEEGFSDIWLTGPASYVFEGQILI